MSKNEFIMGNISEDKLLKTLRDIDPTIVKDSNIQKMILSKFNKNKNIWKQNYCSNASLNNVLRKITGKYKSFFKIIEYQVVVEQNRNSKNSCTAMIKIEVNNNREMTAANGNEPVDALYNVLIKALIKFYPELIYLQFKKYTIDHLECYSRTLTRVVLKLSNGNDSWCTVGVAENSIGALWKSLVNSIEYELNKRMKHTTNHDIQFITR